VQVTPRKALLNLVLKLAGADHEHCVGAGPCLVLREMQIEGKELADMLKALRLLASAMSSS
jgi:hypothetical protein